MMDFEPTNEIVTKKPGKFFLYNFSTQNLTVFCLLHV